MPRAPLKVDELAIHRDPRAITDWNYLGRGRRHHDHHLIVQTRIVAMPADTFFRDNAN